MTTPDTGATGATGATTPTPATPAAPAGPLLTTALKTPAVGTLVTDVELRAHVDQTGKAVLDVDPSGAHIVDGIGPNIGVVVGMDGTTPLVSWLPPASDYGLSLLPLIDPPAIPE